MTVIRNLYTWVNKTRVKTGIILWCIISICVKNRDLHLKRSNNALQFVIADDHFLFFFHKCKHNTFNTLMYYMWTQRRFFFENTIRKIGYWHRIEAVLDSLYPLLKSSSHRQCLLDTKKIIKNTHETSMSMNYDVFNALYYRLCVMVL